MAIYQKWMASTALAMDIKEGGEFENVSTRCLFFCISKIDLLAYTSANELYGWGRNEE